MPVFKNTKEINEKIKEMMEINGIKFEFKSTGIPRISVNQLEEYTKKLVDSINGTN